MKWIKEHKLISLLLAALILAVIILGITYAAGRSKAGVFNSIYISLEKPMTNLGTKIKENVSGLFSYKKILKENESLKKENGELKEKLNKMALSQNDLDQMEKLAKALKYDFIDSGENIITASIVSLDGTNWMNAFTIDKGASDGIKEGSPVLCGEGLVGNVRKVGKDWARVVPIIDESVKISFTVEHNTDILGIIKGSEDGSLTGYMLDNKVDVSDGDQIFTSGMGKYPAGIAIGRVTKTSYESDKQLLSVQVKPYVEFRSISKVSVIL
jgi:rod shape-determining protein MreC